MPLYVEKVEAFTLELELLHQLELLLESASRHTHSVPLAVTCADAEICKSRGHQSVELLLADGRHLVARISVGAARFVVSSEWDRSTHESSSRMPRNQNL